MQPTAIRTAMPDSARLLLLAAATFAFVEIVRNADHLQSALGPAVLLLLPAAYSGYLSSHRTDGPCPRLALAYVLAALLVLPSPAGLLIATVAALAGGVAGGNRSVGSTIAAVGIGVGIAQLFAVLMVSPLMAGSLAVLIRLAILFLLIQSVTMMATLFIDETQRPPNLRAALRAARGLLVETINVPVAWVLVGLVDRHLWLPTVMVCSLTMIGHLAWTHRNRAQTELRRVNGTLISRVGELATLDAVGRRIATTTDMEAIFQTVHVECRKIMHVDACIVATLDGNPPVLQAVFVREHSLVTPESGAQLPAALSRWLIEEQRAVRIIDSLAPSPACPPLEGWLDAECRSALVAPLIVGGTVIGMVSVQCRRPHAYDQHQLRVFTTIVQQAAMAVQNARIYLLASRDSLTGYFVRDHFLARIEEESTRVLRYGGSFGLLMVDLDDFKQINDGHGHFAGDRFLQEITATIRRQLRSVDVPCRFGGDEFCLLLPETDLAGARAIAERIREAVARKIVTVDGARLKTTVSIGLAIFPDGDKKDAEAIMRCADGALYRAKRRGRDRVEHDAA